MARILEIILVICAVLVFQGEASIDDHESLRVDSELLKRAAALRQSLLPLPEGVFQDLVSSWAALYLPVLAESEQCQSHSRYSLDSVLQAQLWALSMVDASSKVSPGLLDGRIQDLGNYDQCMRVREPSQLFIGQHCQVNAYGILPDRLADYLRHKAAVQDYPGGYVSFALCVPSTCSQEDVLTHLNRTLAAAGVNASTERFQIYCSTSESTPLRTKDWLALVVFATIFLLVALSTFYESNASGSKSELLTSFSLVSNWRGLADTRDSPSNISCLSGLRLICAINVMLGHRTLGNYYAPLFNHTTYTQSKGSLLWTLLLSHGHLATETFFVVTGAVRTYTFLRDRHHGKPLGILRQYVLRYFRAAPSLAVVLLFTVTLNVHMSRGPLWDGYMALYEMLCSHLWWTILLHINNFFCNLCRQESWFLAADYQLFLFSPLVLIPLYYRPRLGLGLLATIFALSTGAKVTATFLQPLHPDLVICEGPKMDRSVDLAHANTLYRVSAYVIGIVLGYLLFEVKHGLRTIILPKRTVRIYWSLTVAVLAATPCLQSVFMSPWYEDIPWLAALFLGVVFPMYEVAVAWVVLACTLGQGGWVDRLLSWPVLRPLARLSFSLYMVHVVVQSSMLARIRQPIVYNIFDILFNCLADVVLSFSVALVLHLTVETPFYRLASFLLREQPVPKGLEPTYLKPKPVNLLSGNGRQPSTRSKKRQKQM